MMTNIVSQCESFKNACNKDIWSLFHKELDQFGLQKSLYGFGSALNVSSIKDFRENAFYKTSFDPEYLAAKEEFDEFGDDYFWQVVALAPTPTLWSNVGIFEEATKEQIQALAIDWDHNVITGVTLPIKFSNGLGIGGIGLHAPDMTWAEFDEIWAENAGHIQNIATAFDTCMRKEHVDEHFALSGRERECLLWLASGLRPQQIAYRLNTHPKTVEKQIASARRKLKSDTVAQAVAKALIFGLISP